MSDDELYPFAENAGIAERPEPRERDPFEMLDDLMAVIEELCPARPERGTFADGRPMLL